MDGESHSRPTTPPGPVVTVRVAGSTAFSAGPKEGIVMKAKRIYTPSRIVALVVIGVMLLGLDVPRVRTRRRRGLGARRGRTPAS